MKQATTAPQSAPEHGREMQTKTKTSDDDTNVPLPHEADQSVESQDDHEPREVGKQAHEDVNSGLVDTDRRGGDDYQRASQRDEHVNANSGGKSGGKS
jgi:hypothetical protein